MKQFVALATLFLTANAAKILSVEEGTEIDAASSHPSAQQREKDLAILQEQVERLLTTAGPEVVGFAESLGTIMEKDMMPAVQAAKAKLQEELDGHYASGYDRCDSTLATEKGPSGRLAIKTALLSKAQAQHQTCRTEESEAQAGHQLCSQAEAQLALAKETSCKVVAEYNRAQSSDCEKQTGESEEEYTKRLKDFYAERNQKVKSAEEKCDSDTVAFDNKVEECATLKSTWLSIREACGGQQDTMDEASCDMSEDETTVCDEYSRCYEQATASYEVDLKSVKSQEVGLKNEWAALLRMQCLLRVFSQDTDKQAAFAACGSADHVASANAAIALNFPSPVPKTAQVCQLLAGAAANTHYVAAQYGSLPKNAQAKTCTASCCTTCSEFFCPHGYVNIAGGKDKIGNLKETCCVEGSLFPGSKLASEHHQGLLRDWVKSSRRWTLCYQRSRDGGDSPAAFHKGCDNKGPTVTVMKLSTGKVVGGYNLNSWSSPVLGPYAETHQLWDDYYSPNLERTGFLFSLTTEFKHIQNDRRFLHYNKYATWNGDTMGPNFGLYHRGDLQAFSWEAGKTGDGHRRNKCDIGYTYICRRGQTTEGICREDFCGGFDNFGIEEMEVFYQE